MLGRVDVGELAGFEHAPQMGDLLTDRTDGLIAERFDKLDANADGFISREEFAKAAGS